MMNANNGSGPVKEVEVALSVEDLVKYRKVAVVFKLDRSDNNILSILKHDERLILEEIINTPDISQAELSKVLNFSRQKLWRIIKDLENRGVIERKKYGRTYMLKCSVFNSNFDSNNI